MPLNDDWTEEVRTRHFFETGGRVMEGFGPSMLPHRCGHPDEPCWTVTEVRRVTPWRVTEKKKTPGQP